MKGQSAGNNLIKASETTSHALERDLYWAIGFFEADGCLKVSGGRIY